MRWKPWLQLALRSAVMLLLLVAGIVSLAHEASHMGNGEDCPFCLQSHVQGPALWWSWAQLVPPPRLVRLHPTSPQDLRTELHTFPRPSRAPPASLA